MYLVRICIYYFFFSILRDDKSTIVVKSDTEQKSTCICCVRTFLSLGFLLQCLTLRSGEIRRGKKKHTHLYVQLPIYYEVIGTRCKPTTFKTVLSLPAQRFGFGECESGKRRESHWKRREQFVAELTAPR